MKHLKHINETEFNDDYYEEEDDDNINPIDNHKNLLIGSLRTILHSWGGDTPPEVYWFLSEFVQWYEAEYGVQLGVNDDYQEDGQWAEAVIEAIRNN